MSIRCRLWIAWIAVLATAVTGSPALADTIGSPYSYKKVVPSGKYVFVMISPLTIENDAGGWNEEMAAGIREIRRVYKRSGMYRNDGSTEPLWTVDWYAGVVVASDGVHLIRHGPWPALPESWYKGPLGPALDQEAVSFLANGQLVRTYRIGELVKDPDRLPRSVSHFDWQDKGQLDDAKSEFTLTTLDGNNFVFDIRTGEIVAEIHDSQINWWGYGVALGLLVLITLPFYTWICHRRIAKRITSCPKT
jgi:hypothetical protein